MKQAAIIGCLKKRPARAFVGFMHGHGTFLDGFVSLFHKWNDLSMEEWQEGYDICEHEHIIHLGWGVLS